MKKFDVAIIGSGLVGSVLGAILAKAGFKVVVFEQGVHPKFSIGESLIIEASEVLRTLSELFEVPEIAYFSSESFFPFIGYSHGVKRHFSYLYHRKDKPQDYREVLQAVIPKAPYGHELHLFRQDSDAYMVSVAVKYGATVLQNTPLTNIEIDEHQVKSVTGGGEIYTADYIVDCGGFRSLLADKFKLRDFNLRTHSRSIFTHMTGVPSFHKLGTSKEKFGIPYSLAEGTLHHLFKGGWMWVIPFNNHSHSANPLCSVGLLLDPREYPLDNNLSPEQEFFSVIKQFPGMAEQFQNAKPVRDWVRTGRIQYSSHNIVGDRYCLLGHAGGFIDPLYSKGLYASLSCAGVTASQLIKAGRTKDYSAGAFASIQQKTLGLVTSNDLLISYSFLSFKDIRLWKVYSVVWLLGAYLEGLKLLTSRIIWKKARGSIDTYFENTKSLKLVGGGFPGFDEMLLDIHRILDQVDLNNDSSISKAAGSIKKSLMETEWVPFVMKDLLLGKNHLPRSKFRLRLFSKKGGFMGRGEYRKYFFGDLGWVDLAAFLMREKKIYSVRALKKKHRQMLDRENFI